MGGYNSKVTDEPGPPVGSGSSTALFRQLKSDGVHRCSLLSGQQGHEFLPLSEIRDKITPDSVRTELSTTCAQALRKHPDLPERICNGAQKVFAVLVLVQESGAIAGLIIEGIQDGHLPLSRKGEVDTEDDYSVLVSARGERDFASFKAWPKEVDVDNFLRMQWLVLAPVFDASGAHQEIGANCPLPFKIFPGVAKGLAGAVYRGELHPAHQQGFEDAKIGREIAIKEFETDRETHFKTETDNLEMISSLRHEHLIRHIATCKRGTWHYILFPWADGGNLANFWVDYDKKPRSRALHLWAFRQMLGLVDALRLLHSESIRHGDIKPDNILHFRKRECPDDGDSLGVLVIADVGISKRHFTQTAMRPTPTNTKFTTISYEAPEVEFSPESPRSRRYDTWSIGCMFLEFAVWLLHGRDAVQAFHDRRKSVNHDPMRSPCNFYSRSSEGKPELHEAVVRAMAALGDDPRCEGPKGLRDFLSLIRDRLLQTDVEQRAYAGELHEKLGEIVMKAEEDADYLLNDVDPPGEVPEVFRPRHASSPSTTSPNGVKYTSDRWAN